MEKLPGALRIKSNLHIQGPLEVTGKWTEDRLAEGARNMKDLGVGCRERGCEGVRSAGKIGARVRREGEAGRRLAETAEGVGDAQ